MTGFMFQFIGSALLRYSDTLRYCRMDFCQEKMRSEMEGRVVETDTQKASEVRSLFEKRQCSRPVVLRI